MMFIKKIIVWWNLKFLRKDLRILEDILSDEEDVFKENCFREFCDQIKKTHVVGEDFLNNRNIQISNELLAKYLNARQSLKWSRDKMFSLLQAHKEGKV